MSRFHPNRRAWVAHLMSLCAAAGPFRQAMGAARPTPSRPPPTFPRDFGAHPEARIEWWYITGELGDGGRPAPYGFQITFFRVRTPQAEPSASRLAAPHLLFAHAALTDVQAGRLLHAERLARWNGLSTPNAAADARFPSAQGAGVHDTDLRIARWTLQRGADGAYRGRWGDAPAGFELELVLQPTQPVLLQGQQGWSAKSPRAEHFSRYYSQPQLRAQGTLHLQGRSLAVQGRAWLDHEWSDALLDPEAVGWDWVGLNLDDGSALTAFRLRRADGSALFAGGSLRRPGEPVRAFADHEVVFQPGRTWRSPATGAVYPVEWSIATPAGRHRVVARIDAQELDNRRSTGTVYWEGLSRLLDERGQAIGSGYLEMTGYAAPLRLGA